MTSTVADLEFANLEAPLTHEIRSSTADKLTWLRAHRHLWNDMPDRHNRDAEAYLKVLRPMMVDACLYSLKTAAFDIEMGIFHYIATLRR
jgi:hypothetical protein